MKFYKRDPDRALAGMAELTLKQRGAYNSILDLLYSRDGEVPDDDQRVARMISCHWREWASTKADLIKAGKIWLEGGMIRAKRVQETIKEAADFAQDQSRRASSGWQKRKNDSKNNDSIMPPGNALTATATATPTATASLRSENGESLTPAPAQAHAREAGEAGQSGKAQNPYDRSFQVSAKVIWGREVLGILGYDWNHYEAVGKNYGLLFRLEAEGFSQDDITEAARRVVLGWGGNQPTDKNNPLRYFERGLRENLASIGVKSPEPTNVVPIEKPKVPINRPISKEEDDAYYENIRRNRLRAEEYLRNRSSLSIKEVLRS